MEFDRVEACKLSDDHIFIACSFETTQFGYVQIEFKEKNDVKNISPMHTEPDWHMFTKEDREYMKVVLHIVARLIGDSQGYLGKFE